MEFQAVILAAGHGSRMRDLTSKIPKCLLSVANLPLIWYPVQMLEKAGFEDHEDYGTADSLRAIKDKIHTDLLVISCDLIADLPLQRIADLHRAQVSTVTMVTMPALDPADTSVPGGKANKLIERDFLGLEHNSSRVLFFSSESDFEETVTFKKSIFKRFPRMRVRTSVSDAHVYFLQRRVLEVLEREPSISSLRGELIPYLVRQQFSKNWRSEISAGDVMDKGESVSDDMDLSAVALSLSASAAAADLSKQRGSRSDIRCHAFMLTKEDFCIRANSLLCYCEANRQVPRHLNKLSADDVIRPLRQSSVVIKARSTIGPDSLVGDCTSIGDKVGIKKSTIGKHCKISDRVKITNCVIMDHVIVQEGCILTGCVIADNAYVGEKTELKDCLVGSSQQVVALGKFNNEVLVEIDRMMEI